MPKHPEFHPDLDGLLDAVWKYPLPRIESYNDIYRLYTRRSGEGRAFEEKVLKAFLNDLCNLAEAMDMRPRIQQGPSLDCQASLPHASASPERLWRTFYHFLAPDRRAALKRVYVHVADPFDKHWLPVMEELVSHLKARTTAFEAVKVAGPYNAHRRDQIVAYARTAEAQKAIVDTLWKVRKHLQQGVPMCVSEVLDRNDVGIGVGTADEPPHVRLLESDERPPAQSFGTYLAKAIWWAVEQSLKVETHKRGFLNNAKQALESVGIDPQKPHLHPERWQIEELSRRGEEAQRRRNALAWANKPADHWA